MQWRYDFTILRDRRLLSALLRFAQICALTRRLDEPKPLIPFVWDVAPGLPLV